MELTLTIHRYGLKKVFAKKIMYFGHDRNKALIAAAVISSRWDALQAQGHRVWPESEWTAALLEKDRILNGGTLGEITAAATAAAPATAPAPTTSKTKSITLYNLIQKFIDETQARVPEISQNHASQIRYRMLNLKRVTTDCDVSTIDISWIKSRVRYYRGRPKTSTGNAMAIDTLRNQIGALRQLLDFADQEGYWIAPSRFTKLFACPFRKLMTEEERTAATEHASYTFTDLAKIYKITNDQHKAWILLGLCCAFCTQELSDLTCKEIDFKTCIIRRVRGKTGVVGVWSFVAWPELKALLLTLTKGKAASARVFHRPDGKSLVTFKKTGKVDGLSPVWRKMCTRAGVVNQGFKVLRKMSGQLIRDISGSRDLSELQLSHSSAGHISSHYTHQGHEPLFLAQAEARRRLQPFFDEVLKGSDGKATETPATPAAEAA